VTREPDLVQIGYVLDCPFFINMRRYRDMDVGTHSRYDLLNIITNPDEGLPSVTQVLAWIRQTKSNCERCEQCLKDIERVREEIERE